MSETKTTPVSETKTTPVRDYAGIVAWIKANVTDLGSPTVEEAALWFWSVRRAGETADYGDRELAELFQHGVVETSPELIDEDCEEEEDWSDFDLRSALDEFFLPHNGGE